MSIKITILIYC